MQKSIPSIMRGKHRAQAAVLASVLAAVGFLAACSSNNSSSSSSASAAGGTSSVSGGKHYTITFAGVVPQGNPAAVEQDAFAAAIQKSTGGQITVKNYYNGTLGTVASIVTQVNSGAIQAATFAPSNYASYSSDLNVLSLPFLFSSEQEAVSKLNGPAGTTIAQQLIAKSNLYPLSWGSLGFTQLLTASPAHSVNDLKGVRLRAIPAQINEAVETALGAQPTPLDSTEVLTSMESGTVHGDIDPLAQYYSLKEYTAVKNVTMVNITFNPALLVINKKFFQSLPKDLQQDVSAAAQSAATKEVAAQDAATASATTALKAAGVTFYTPTAAQQAQFKAAVAKVTSSYEQANGATLTNALK
jgi:TRAP-type C4-dicarboxylate transport system substrate-binding protein